MNFNLEVSKQNGYSSKSRMESSDHFKNGARRKSLTNRKKNIFILCLLFSISFSGVNAQPSTKKGKMKTIEYMSVSDRRSRVHELVAIGFVYKKQFVEGQELSFLDRSSDIYPVGDNAKEDTIISGTYSMKNGNAYINGVFYNGVAEYFFEGYNQFVTIGRSSQGITKGLFKVTNCDDGKSITTKSRESLPLKIETVEISYYQGYYPQTIINFGNIKPKPVTLQKQSNGDYLLKIKLDKSILETAVSANLVKANLVRKDGYFDFDYMIKNSSAVTVTYNNGNIFTGTLTTLTETEKKHYVEKKHYDVHFRMVKGTIRYSSGEIFTGEFRIDESIPTHGKMVFADGSVETGDWLKKYNVLYKEVSKAKNLTEMHNLAIQISAEKEKEIARKKQEEYERKQEENRQKQQRKQTFIAKYGDYYGTLISEGKLDVGMSKAMVNEVWRRNYFRISTMVRNGQSIEIWEYDKEKRELELFSETNSGEEALMVNYLLYIGELFGYKAPKMLIFTNDKLTDIYN